MLVHGQKSVLIFILIFISCTLTANSTKNIKHKRNASKKDYQRIPAKCMTNAINEMSQGD